MLITLFSLLVSFASAQESVTTIAVIDTGFGWSPAGTPPDSALCKFGHKDFTDDQEFTKDLNTEDKVPKDKHGHGTNIAGVIDKYAKDGEKPYCLVILKYYRVQDSGLTSLANEIKAIKWATKLKVSIINYSGGGPIRSAEEEKAVKEYLDQGGIFVTSAGNDGIDLDKYNFFPASYDKRIVVVGNKHSDEPEFKDGKKVADFTRSPTSSYGKEVTRWEFGENVVGYNVIMTGTSQATAIVSGKIAAEWKKDMIQATKRLRLEK